MITDLLGIWSKREKQQWLGALLCGCMCLFATRQTMPLCLTEVANELNWDKQDMGCVLSAFFWGYTLTQIVGGYLSDRMGGSTVLTTAAIGWSVMTLLMPRIIHTFASHYWSMLIIIASRVLMGAFQGFHYPAMTSLLSQKAPECERAFSLSFVTSGAPVGTLIAGGVGSYLLEHLGWQYPFYVMGLLSLFWLLYVRIYMARGPKQRKNTQRKLKANNFNLIAPVEQGPVPWKALLSKGAFWAIVVGQFCSDNAWFILLSWSPTFFKESFPSSTGWVCNVLPWMVSVPCRWIAGLTADHLITIGYSTTFVRKLMQSISFIGGGTFLILLPYGESYEWALSCVTLSLACAAFHNAGILVNPQDIAPKYAGSVFGLMSTAGAIPGVLGVYVVGYVLETTKSWAPVFTKTGLLCYLGCFVFLVFGTGKPIIVED